MILIAIKETFKKKWWAIFSTTISGYITFLLVGKNFFGMEPAKSFWVACYAGLAIIVFRFTYVLGKISVAESTNDESSELKSQIEQLNETINKNQEDKESFEQIFEYLNLGMSAVHWLRSQEKKDETYLGILDFLCCQLKYVFDEKTNTKCAVSIKIPVQNTEINASTRVMNICRDKWSIRRNVNSYKAKHHHVYNNTPFNNITVDLVEEDKELPFYLNNDIPNTHGYQNSSMDTYVEGGIGYKSEIVVPIIPYNKPAGTRFIALGFLCVDSTESLAFDDKIDIAILQGVADCIHDVIKQREGLIKPDQFLIVEDPNATMKATPFTLKDRKPKRKK